MKSSASISISLTLLMIILVLVAGFWFLFQDRQTLIEDLSASQENIRVLENQQAEMELNEQALQATLQVEQELHATTTFENVDLEGQILESNNNNATLEAVSEEQDSQLEAANATVTAVEAQGPTVTIVEPQADQNVTVDQAVEIVIVASDPKGVIKVLYNTDEELLSQTFDGGDLVTLREFWTPTMPGTFTITASAVNSREVPSKSSELSAVTINVVPLQPTETPLPTETPEPIEEPTPES